LFNYFQSGAIRSKSINFSASGRLPDVAGGGSSSKDFPPIDAQWIEVRAKKAALKVRRQNSKSCHAKLFE
jgi:hypothetical protein